MIALISYVDVKPLFIHRQYLSDRVLSYNPLVGKQIVVNIFIYNWYKHFNAAALSANTGLHGLWLQKTVAEEPDDKFKQ